MNRHSQTGTHKAFTKDIPWNTFSAKLEMPFDDSLLWLYTCTFIRRHVWYFDFESAHMYVCVNFTYVYKYVYGFLLLFCNITIAKNGQKFLEICARRCECVYTMCACRQACTHIFTYIHTYIHTCEFMYTMCACRKAFTYIFAYMHACMHTYMWMRVYNVWMSTSFSTYIYIHTYIHTHIHVNACIPMCMSTSSTHIFTYIHAYIHTYMWIQVVDKLLHTSLHTYIHTYIHVNACIPMCMSTSSIHIFTYIHTYISLWNGSPHSACIHMRTYMHAYIHIGLVSWNFFFDIL